MGTHPIFESDFDCLTERSLSSDIKMGMTTRMQTSRATKGRTPRRPTHVEPLGPQVRKLNSMPTLAPTTAEPLQRIRNTEAQGGHAAPTRNSAASALHLGRAACSVPEHDAMARKNERLKEVVKRERETVATMKSDFVVMEDALLREKASLQARVDELLAEKRDMATRHEDEIALLTEKHAAVQTQVERNHQREIAEQIKRADMLISDKQKSIDKLKQQIAENMRDQSSARHAQIEELRKKLIDAAKEANELKNELLRYRSDYPSSQVGRQSPQVRIGVCMNCIVMQQALTMANAALKAKMRELQRIERVGEGIRLGLQLNDLALDAMDPGTEKSNK